MNQIVMDNWLLIILALAIGFFVAWWVFHATRRTRIDGTTKDVLDEGATRASRNTALIDTAPAATRDTAVTPPPATPVGMAGMGTVVAQASEEAALERAKSEGDLPESAVVADTDPEPVAEPAMAPTPSVTTASGDDLSRMKGVGPKLVAMLRDMGVTRFDQIAAWDDADIDRIDAQLGRFSGRIRRDDWVGQARLLAAGDEAGYNASYGNG